MNSLGKYIQTFVDETDTVLDIGCGIMQGTDDLKCKFILGCDIWMPYLDKIKENHPTVKITMDELDKFPDSSYDVVICIDSIEHISKENALNVLDEMKRICRRKALVYTPAKFDTNENSVNDSWGMGKCVYQTHRCLVDKNDMRKRGYKLTGTDPLFGVYIK